MSFTFEDPVRAAFAIRATHLDEIIIMFRHAFALWGLPTKCIARECEKLEKACRKEGLIWVARRLEMLRDGDDPESGYDLNVAKATCRLPNAIMSDIDQIATTRDILIEKVHELASHK